MKKIIALLLVSSLSYANAQTIQPLATSGGGTGSGTVTSASVTPANGVSATVTTPTTTPAFTFTLGAITPTTVNGNTVPTASDTVALLAAAQTLSSKTLAAATFSTSATFSFAAGGGVQCAHFSNTGVLTPTGTGDCGTGGGSSTITAGVTPTSGITSNDFIGSTGNLAVDTGITFVPGALSILANAVNSTALPTWLACSNANGVFMRVGNALSCGQLLANNSFGAANSLFMNDTSSAASMVSVTIPACAADGAHALIYTSGTGFTCQALTGGGGGVTPTGTFTLGDMMIASGGSSIQDSLAFGTNGGMSFSGGSVPAFASCYFNDIQTCITENARLRERVFIGNAVNMNDTSATGPNGTFLSSALVGPNFIARGAQALSMSDVGGIAIAGMTEMANLLGGQSTIGGAFSCLANGAAGTCQAKYSEAQFNPNTITGSAAISDENDCKNASSANNASDPFASPPGCRGYWAAAGGGKGYGPGLITNAATSTSSAVISAASVPAFVTAGQLAFDNTTNAAIGTVASATTTTVTLTANTPVAIASSDYITFTFPSDAAYNVVANQNVWRSSFNVQNGSQAPDGNGNFNTFQAPLQSSFYWYSAAATIADTIRGDATNGLFFKGTGSTNDLVWENKNGTVVAQIPTGSSNFNVAPAGSAAAPSLTVGNLTTGFHSVGTTGFGIDVNGVTQFDFGIHAGARLTATPTMEGANAAGWLLNSNGASSTVPTIIPNQASTTTGIGAIASGEISEIVAGVDMGDWTSTGLALSHVPTAPTATVGTNTTQIATTAFVLANAAGGAVSSVTGGVGVTVAPTTGAVIVSTPATVRSNTATTDTITNADRGTIVSENNASAIAAAITTTGFVSTDYFTIKNIGAGVATYTPSSGTIDGAATLVCKQNQSADLTFDGTNYHTLGNTCVTNAQLTANINLASGSLSGALPAFPNNTTTYFRGDGTYDTLNAAAVAGLGTAATQATGTSGASLPFLNGTNVWSGLQTFGTVVGTVTTQSGTTYTFASTDCGTLVRFSSTTTVTATIPQGLPVGCNIAAMQGSTGQVKVNGTAVTPATLLSAHSFTGTFNGAGAIIGIATDATNHATLTGDGA